MEHFKQELVEYLDYYNNRRIRAKQNMALTFWDHLKTADVLLFIW